MILFVFIYALVGMQYFANRLHFDAVTGEHVPLSAVVARFEANNGRSVAHFFCRFSCSFVCFSVLLFAHRFSFSLLLFFSSSLLLLLLLFFSSSLLLFFFSSSLLLFFSSSLLLCANYGSAVGLDIAEPRSNFNTALLAVLTIVQIFTGEDWNAVLYDAMRSGQSAAASIYFISIICLGSFVMLDFFLAILLSDFDDAAQEEDAYQREIRKQIEGTRCGKKVRVHFCCLQLPSLLC